MECDSVVVLLSLAAVQLAQCSQSMLVWTAGFFFIVGMLHFVSVLFLL